MPNPRRTFSSCKKKGALGIGEPLGARSELLAPAFDRNVCAPIFDGILGASAGVPQGAAVLLTIASALFRKRNMKLKPWAKLLPTSSKHDKRNSSATLASPSSPHRARFHSFEPAHLCYPKICRVLRYRSIECPRFAERRAPPGEPRRIPESTGAPRHHGHNYRNARRAQDEARGH